MQKTKLLVSLLGAFVAMPALAEEGSGSPFSAEIRLMNDYLLRGISQTGGKPAIQGSVAYEHSSGFYAEIEGSNDTFFKDVYKETGGTDGSPNANMEIKVALGFKNKFAEDFSYDVGYRRFNYPGSYAPGATKGDTDEIYGGLGYKWISAQYSYSLGKTFGVPGASGTGYFEINADFPLAESWKVGAHVGKQNYKGTPANTLAAAGRNPSYTDYKVGVTKEISGFELGLAYSRTNASTGVGTFYNVLGRDLGKGAFVASVSYAFK